MHIHRPLLYMDLLSSYLEIYNCIVGLLIVLRLYVTLQLGYRLYFFLT